MSSTTISTIEMSRLAEKGRILVRLYGSRVYDVTDFVDDHPGGEHLITDLKNEDVTAVMADPTSHDHSQSAYEMMEEYFIGVNPDLQQLDAVEDEEREYAVHSKLSAVTDYSRDYKENKFLDLHQPLLPQMLRARWTKEFYLEQVHKPRHYGQGSAQIFGNFLEPLSLTPWWVIPLVWIPVNLFVISVALRGLEPSKVAALYGVGLMLWTLVEYILHRFLFHVDSFLPDHQLAFTLHFLLHGFHHYLPMDKMRLVLPPTLMFILAPPWYKLCHVVFRNYFMAQAVFAGAHMGYIMYDCTHYFLHHKRLPEVFRSTKVYHLDHHYKNYDQGYGVTSRFWDWIFNTELES